jgi:riboflavin synthase
MFTGIIETVGKLQAVVENGSNVDLIVESPVTGALKPDQSVAHNGVCLTVVEIKGETYRVTAVAETLAKTTIGSWRSGTEVNLERALKLGDRLDGHFVQGHVDATGQCIRKEQLEGSWLFAFSFPEEFAPLLIEKGSICINGVSLTAFEVKKSEFTVTIIPYTFNHTTFGLLNEGEMVNLEFDVLGKYFLRGQQLRNIGQ